MKRHVPAFLAAFCLLARAAAQQLIYDPTYAGTAQSDLDLGAHTVTGGSWNGPSQLVQLDPSGKLPRLDGANLANVQDASLAHSYLMAHFLSGDNSLYLSASADGKRWRLVGGAKARYDGGPHNSVRDPSLVKLGNTYYVAHTNNNFNATTSFTVASSPDLIHWTRVADVDCSGVSGTDEVWAPEWFVDGDGSVHILVALSKNLGASDQAFQIYETHPATPGAYAAWSVPAPVTGTSLPPDLIDPYLVKAGGTYFLFCKDDRTGYIDLLTSSSLASGYSVDQSGNWAGWGQAEGPCVVPLAGGRYRAYFYGLPGGGVSFSDSLSSGLAGAWSSPAPVSTDAATSIDHGTVLVEYGAAGLALPMAAALQAQTVTTHYPSLIDQTLTLAASAGASLLVGPAAPFGYPSGFAAFISGLLGVGSGYAGGSGTGVTIGRDDGSSVYFEAFTHRNLVLTSDSGIYLGSPSNLALRVSSDGRRVSVGASGLDDDGADAFQVYGASKLNGSLTVAGTVSSSHLLGGSAAPSIVSGAGAGTVPTVAVNGTDLSGTVTVITGAAPAASSVLATLTFALGYGAAPHPVLCPGNAAAAALSGNSAVYPTATASTLVLNAGAAAPAAATTYVWNYQLSQ